MTMADETEVPEDDELGDYERGFVDGWLFSRGIGIPSQEQRIEALNELERFLKLKQPTESRPN